MRSALAQQVELTHSLQEQRLDQLTSLEEEILQLRHELEQSKVIHTWGIK